MGRLSILLVGVLVCGSVVGDSVEVTLKRGTLKSEPVAEFKSGRIYDDGSYSLDLDYRFADRDLGYGLRFNPSVGASVLHADSDEFAGLNADDLTAYSLKGGANLSYKTTVVKGFTFRAGIDLGATYFPQIDGALSATIPPSGVGGPTTPTLPVTLVDDMRLWKNGFGFYNSMNLSVGYNITERWSVSLGYSLTDYGQIEGESGPHGNVHDMDVVAHEVTLSASWRF